MQGGNCHWKWSVSSFVYFPRRHTATVCPFSGYNCQHLLDCTSTNAAHPQCTGDTSCTSLTEGEALLHFLSRTFHRSCHPLPSQPPSLLTWLLVHWPLNHLRADLPSSPMLCLEGLTKTPFPHSSCASTVVCVQMHMHMYAWVCWRLKLTLGAAIHLSLTWSSSI